jgi:branched-chain amino acid aminotransferase
MSLLISINRKIDVPQKQQMPYLNRGFLFGDGVFTTILATNANLEFWEEHMLRLTHDARVFRLNFNQEGLYQAVQDLLACNQLNQSHARVRITLTRSQSTRSTLALQEDESPLEIITTAPYTPPKSSVKMTISSVSRGVPGRLTETKHLGYQASLLALYEANDNGFDDAILLNHLGRVSCATTASVFAQIDGSWITPTITEGALPGIYRNFLLKSKKAKEGTISVEQLLGAKACFLTNSLIKIRPIYSINEMMYDQTNLFD